MVVSPCWLARKVTLTLNGNKLIQYTIDRGTVDSLVSNKEAIEAGEGLIILSAKGLESVSQAVVNNTGTVKADSITKKGGKIFLTARNGSVNNAGSVSANSKENIGGDIEITADEIVVLKEAKISANRRAGWWPNFGWWILAKFRFRCVSVNKHRCCRRICN